MRSNLRCQFDMPGRIVIAVIFFFHLSSHPLARAWVALASGKSGTRTWLEFHQPHRESSKDGAK
jgi:hypothetical protein